MPNAALSTALSALILGAAALTLSACAPADAHEHGPDTHTHGPDTHTHDMADTAGTLPTLDDIAEPKLSVTPLRPNMDALIGPGGNIAVLYGEDGALLVDDKFADNADEILARVGARSGARPVFVLNTHYHGDHTGSNAEMKAAGAVVVAHHGARELMASEIENRLFGRTVEAREPAAFPDMTFRSDMTIDFATDAGGDRVDLIHVPAAHTSGDLIVHFRAADVLHLGDNFFNGMFPYVDIDAGGSLQGMIDAQKTALDLAGADTVVVPGHGPITDRDGLAGSIALLEDIRDRMQARLDAGADLDTVLAADIYDDLGMDDGFINQERIARIAFRSLSQE